MSELVNFKWPQGEDLNIQLVYKEGETSARAIAVPLNSGYSLRMDIVNPADRSIVYSFVSDEHPGTLGSGINKQPNINIFLPRDLTLPGGAIYELLTNGSGGFSYDIFLRNNQTDRQVKILKGSIAVEASVTLWQ